jgi:hypothetical protein
MILICAAFLQVEGLVDVGHASIDIRGGGLCRQCMNWSDDRPSIYRRVPPRGRANRITPAIVPTAHDDESSMILRMGTHFFKYK